MTGAERSIWDVPDEHTTPAWLAKRRLAAALREAIALAVTSDAPADVLDRARGRIADLLADLAPHPGDTFGQAMQRRPFVEDHLLYLDRNTIVGRSNPIAPPIRLDGDGDLSLGRVCFGPPYEGAPGFVHGGIVAAGFDQVFGHVQMRRGIPSMTGNLTVRFRKPTPILRELRYEAWLARESGKKSFVEARLLDGDAVLAEAEALFVAIEPRRVGGASEPAP